MTVPSTCRVGPTRIDHQLALKALSQSILLPFEHALRLPHSLALLHPRFPATRHGPNTVRSESLLLPVAACNSAPPLALPSGHLPCQRLFLPNSSSTPRWAHHEIISLREPSPIWSSFFASLPLACETRAPFRHPVPPFIHISCEFLVPSRCTFILLRLRTATFPYLVSRSDTKSTHSAVSPYANMGNLCCGEDEYTRSKHPTIRNGPPAPKVMTPTEAERRETARVAAEERARKNAVRGTQRYTYVFISLIRLSLIPLPFPPPGLVPFHRVSSNLGSPPQLFLPSPRLCGCEVPRQSQKFQMQIPPPPHAALTFRCVAVWPKLFTSPRLLSVCLFV